MKQGVVRRTGQRLAKRPKPPERSGGLLEVEAVELHHLGPHMHEVVDELLIGVVRGIHLGNGAQLRVRPEHEVDRRTRPHNVTTFAAPSLVDPVAPSASVHMRLMSSKLTKKALVNVPG